MNSPLINYTRPSPNQEGQRRNPISRITPHCVVGQCSVETLGGVFASPARKASSNYGIGVDGRVGLYVDEGSHSWCSSNWDNDDKAVTIECASDAFAPYAFKSQVYARLVDLCVDICQRHNKTRLIWIADKDKALSYQLKSDEMLLTVHRWFASKSCPGDWMFERMGELASQVTARLNPGEPEPELIYRVQEGAYHKKSGAEAHLKALKEIRALPDVQIILKKYGLENAEPFILEAKR